MQATLTTVDFGPLVSAIIAVLGTIITGLIIPLIVAYIGKAFRAWGVEAQAEQAAIRATLDQIAQKAIANVVGKLQSTPDLLTVDAKSEFVAEAAELILKNGTESLKKLGVPNNELVQKSLEMVTTRLGLIQAAAAGTPIPNPSQNPPVPPNPVSVNPVG